jgi:hypothetical protein
MRPPSLLFIAVVAEVVASTITPPRDSYDYDYIVVGAGSAGLQMGLFLEREDVSYVIYEQGPSAGQFWTRFPVAKELISINANHPSERYDWHGLLGAPLRFRNVSKRYFPHRSDYHAYLNAVAATLNVEYETKVARLVDGPCVLLARGAHKCARHRVFVGTGTEEIAWPALESAGSVPYGRFNVSTVEGEDVCILGNGNSAWEMAQASFETAQSVSVYGRRPTRWSMVTKYSGDVRIKYAQNLENFQSKLLSFTSPIRPPSELVKMTTAEYIAFVRGFMRTQKGIARDPDANERPVCTLFFHAFGFRSLVPGGLDAYDNTRLFPPDVGVWYETDISRVHYIGWHMHKHDFRRGAGGFANGFRYLIRNLFSWVRAEDTKDAQEADIVANVHSGGRAGVVAPANVQLFTNKEVADHMWERIASTAADILIMQDGRVLRDVVEFTSGGKWSYLDGCNFNFLPPERQENAITFYFGWGNIRSAQTVLEEQFWTDEKTPKLRNIMLHPIIEWRGKSVHLSEEPLNRWGDSDRLRETLEDVLAELFEVVGADRANGGGRGCEGSGGGAGDSKQKLNKSIRMACRSLPPAVGLSARWLSVPDWGMSTNDWSMAQERPYWAANVL